ncbi:SH3 domain-containing protein [Candidatus Obscuribacterales bacterium]|nr:SH3 domain-containing protein [Candidatus Obscuribacterales bacterium]
MRKMHGFPRLVDQACSTPQMIGGLPLRLSSRGLLIAVVILLLPNENSFAQERCRVVDPTGSPLNVRNEPNGRIVTTLKNGEFIVVLDRSTDRSGKLWVRVKRNDQADPLGWVFGNFTTCSRQSASSICLDAQKRAASLSDVRLTVPRVTNAKIASGEVTIEVKSGKFSCRSESSRKSKTFCSSRVVNLKVLTKNQRGLVERVRIPDAAYEGLEDPSDFQVLPLSSDGIALLIGVRDGAAAATVCLVVQSAILVHRATIIGSNPESSVILEETKFK